MPWYVAPTLNVLLAEINTKAPGRSKRSDGAVGDTSHQARPSDHNPDGRGCVHARDVTHDPAGGFDAHAFADWVRDQVNAGRMRVKYVISNGRIFNPSISPAWRAYTGSNRHDHHVHVSIKTNIGEDDHRPWGWSTSSPHEEPDMTPQQSASLANIEKLVADLKREIIDPRNGNNVAARVAAIDARLARVEHKLDA